MNKTLFITLLLFTMLFSLFNITDVRGEDSPFQGEWVTNFGKITIKSQVVYVDGTYGDDGGTFTGFISDDGKSIRGKWFSPPSYGPGFDAGKFQMVISEDGSSFTGKVWQDQGKNIRKLVGIRLSDISDNFSGIWDTDKGIMVLMVKEGKVTGNYEDQDGKFEGTVLRDGKTIEGTWGEKPDYKAPENGGALLFHLSDDWQGFKIEIWNGEKQGSPSNTWGGKRIN